MLWLFLLFINEGQRFQVVIKYLTFFIRQFQECVIQVVQAVFIFFISHLVHTVFHRGASGTGGQVQLYLVQADGFWRHDFVVFTIFQYAVLMDAGRVGKGAASDNGFVCRNWHVADLAD